MPRWSQVLFTSSEMRVPQNYTFSVAANEQRCWNISAAMLHLVIVIFILFYFITIYGFRVFISLLDFELLDHLLSSLVPLPHPQDQILCCCFYGPVVALPSCMYDRFRIKFEAGCLAPAHHMADVGCIDLVYQKNDEKLPDTWTSGVLRAVGGVWRFTLCNGSFCSPFTWFDCSVIFSRRVLMPHI